MEDVMTRVLRLRRPRLLIEAAQIGRDAYCRDRDLPKLLGQQAGTGAAIVQLLDQEAEVDAARRNRGRGYRPARHIGLLTALMSEAEAARTQAAGRAEDALALIP